MASKFNRRSGVLCFLPLVLLVLLANNYNWTQLGANKRHAKNAWSLADDHFKDSVALAYHRHNKSTPKQVVSADEDTDDGGALVRDREHISDVMMAAKEAQSSVEENTKENHTDLVDERVRVPPYIEGDVITSVTRDDVANHIERYVMTQGSFGRDIMPLHDRVLDILRDTYANADVITHSTATANVSAHRGRIKVHVLASFHGGSTFTGDLFAAHGDVYYLFEPLSLLDLASRWFTARNNQHIVSYYMSKLFNCSFHELLLRSYREPNIASKSVRARAFFHRVFEKKPPPSALALVTKHSFANTTRQQRTSLQILYQRYEPYCRQRFKYSVIKTIRIESLLGALPLLLRGVKTIHLVRDPRGLLASRLKVGKQKAMASVEKLCDQHAKNVEFLEQLSRIPFMRHVLNENYRLVRYEEISYDTMKLSRQLYDFSGIPLTDSALERIIRLASNDTTFSIHRETQSYHVASAKSKAIATKWRYRLTTEQIRHVEQVCAPAMRQLGYVILSDDEQYTNDTIDLIVPHIQSSFIPIFN